jgi:GT2 family glycosyltransferase
MLPPRDPPPRGGARARHRPFGHATREERTRMPGPTAAPPARAQTVGSWPSVTVVVVNHNGRGYLEECLGSLRAQTYPADQIEVIFIDNASSDGSVELVRSAFPEVQVVVNDTNTGFSPAVNQGARLAAGTYLALLNNDAAADPTWLRAAVHELEGEPTIACVASKILRQDRVTVDYAGGQMAFYGHGFARGVELDDTGDGRNRDTLFASGGAMVVRTRTFLDVGGFDDSYFAFFEDVDFGWRLQVLGHRVRYVPSSRVYHRHHGTMERFGFAREAYLLERNALATIYKNYSDEQLARVLPTSVILSVLRGIDVEGHELPDFRIRDGAKPIGDLTVAARTGAHLAALRDFALMLDDLTAKRSLIQQRRVVGDRAILRLFEESLRPNVFEPDFLEAFEQLVRAFDLHEHARARSRVLLITADQIGEQMDAGGIRAWEMARELAVHHDVTLACAEPPGRHDPAFVTTIATPDAIDAQLGRSDVVVCYGLMLDRFPQVSACDLPVILDLHDPPHLAGTGSGARSADVAAADIESLNRHLRRADLVVCASGKQRDLWLGQLSGLGRVNPATFDADSSLRSLLAVVPTGIPKPPPAQPGRALRGVVPGIGPDDFVLAWPGGIEDWQDPLTLISAVAAAADDRPDLRLVVLPPPVDGPRSRMAERAKKAALDLDVLGSHVVFIEERPTYDRRADLLVEADVGVQTRLGDAGGAFVLRPGVSDCIWANLPLLATEGDAVGDAIRDEGLGLAVPPGDVEALTRAILTLHDDADLRAAARAAVDVAHRDLVWETAITPVMELVSAPRPAADRSGRAARYVAQRTTLVRRPPAYYVSRFAEYARAMGPRAAVVQAVRLLRRRRGR